jgi:hypothetical protein
VQFSIGEEYWSSSHDLNIYINTVNSGDKTLGVFLLTIIEDIPLIITLEVPTVGTLGLVGYEINYSLICLLTYPMTRRSKRE